MKTTNKNAKWAEKCFKVFLSVVMVFALSPFSSAIDTTQAQAMTENTNTADNVVDVQQESQVENTNTNSYEEEEFEEDEATTEEAEGETEEAQQGTEEATQQPSNTEKPIENISQPDELKAFLDPTLQLASLEKTQVASESDETSSEEDYSVSLAALTTAWEDQNGFKVTGDKQITINLNGTNMPDGYTMQCSLSVGGQNSNYKNVVYTFTVTLTKGENNVWVPTSGTIDNLAASPLYTASAYLINDGSYAALTQDFSYASYWSSKGSGGFPDTITFNATTDTSVSNFSISNNSSDTDNAATYNVTTKASKFVKFIPLSTLWSACYPNESINTTDGWDQVWVTKTFDLTKLSTDIFPSDAKIDNDGLDAFWWSHSAAGVRVRSGSNSEPDSGSGVVLDSVAKTGDTTVSLKYCCNRASECICLFQSSLLEVHYTLDTAKTETKQFELKGGESANVYSISGDFEATVIETPPVGGTGSTAYAYAETLQGGTTNGGSTTEDNTYTSTGWTKRTCKYTYDNASFYSVTENFNYQASTCNDNNLNTETITNTDGTTNNRPKKVYYTDLAQAITRQVANGDGQTDDERGTIVVHKSHQVNKVMTTSGLGIALTIKNVTNPQTDAENPNKNGTNDSFTVAGSATKQPVVTFTQDAQLICFTNTMFSGVKFYGNSNQARGEAPIKMTTNGVNMALEDGAGGSLPKSGLEMAYFGASGATHGGGTILYDATGGAFTMTGGEIHDNYAGVAGGLWLDGPTQTYDITGGKIYNNVASTYGGGIYSGTGVLTLKNVEITGNHASTYGSAVALYGESQIVFDDGTLITANTSDGSAGSRLSSDGGAIAWGTTRSTKATTPCKIKGSPRIYNNGIASRGTETIADANKKDLDMSVDSDGSLLTVESVGDKALIWYYNKNTIGTTFGQKFATSTPVAGSVGNVNAFISDQLDSGKGYVLGTTTNTPAADNTIKWPDNANAVVKITESETTTDSITGTKTAKEYIHPYTAIQTAINAATTFTANNMPEYGGTQGTTYFGDNSITKFYKIEQLIATIEKDENIAGLGKTAAAATFNTGDTIPILYQKASDSDSVYPFKTDTGSVAYVKQATNYTGLFKLLSGKLCITGIILDGNEKTNGTGVGLVYQNNSTSQLFIGDGTSETVIQNGVSTGNAGGIGLSSGQATLRTNALITGCKTGTSASGGGVAISAGGSLNLKGGTIQNCTARYGGGIYLVAGASFSMYDGSIGGYVGTSTTKAPNTASSGNGGGICTDGGSTSNAQINLYGGTISNNIASGSGGGIASAAHVTMEKTTYNSKETDGVTISGNEATDGAGLVIYGNNTGSDAFTLKAGNISGNTASGDGGGVCISGSTATMTMSGGTIGGGESDTKNTGNTAQGTATTNGGGGVYATNGATLSMTGGTISYNNAAAGGGGVRISSSATFEMKKASSTATTVGSINNNKALGYGGGGIFNCGGTSVTVSAGKIQSNESATTGGGIAQDINGGTINISGTFSGAATDTIISLNKTAKMGGGVYIGSGTLNMSGGKITNNTFSNTTGKGGGIGSNDSKTVTMNISGGEISSNSEATDSVNGVQYGGGIYVGANTEGNVTISGTTTGTVIKSNGAKTQGGGIYYGGSGTLTIKGGTIGGKDAGNTALAGGGIYVNSGNFTVQKDTGVTPNTVPEISYNVATGTANSNGTGNGGGVYIGESAGTITLSDGTFSNNKAGEEYVSNGGAIYSGKSIEISGGTYDSNIAKFGGAVSFSGESNKLTVTGGTFKNNTASDYGGALHATAAKGQIEINKTTSVPIFYNNAATTYNGGAVFLAGTLTVSDGKFYGNHVDAGQGGVFANNGGATNITGGIYGGDGKTTDANGIKNSKNYTITNTENKGYGGVLYSTIGAVTISGVTAVQNEARYGGFVAVGGTNGTLTISGGTFTNNYGKQSGGVVLASKHASSVTISDGTFKGNHAGTYGGVMLLGCSGEISGGTFGTTTANEGNYAARGGVAYVDQDTGKLTISGSPSISGNATTGSGDHGAIEGATAGTNTVTVSGSPTIYDNVNVRNATPTASLSDNTVTTSNRRDVLDQSDKDSGDVIKVGSTGLGANAKIGVYASNSYAEGDTFAHTYNSSDAKEQAAGRSDEGNFRKFINNKNGLVGKAKVSGTAPVSNLVWTGYVCQIVPSSGDATQYYTIKEANDAMAKISNVSRLEMLVDDYEITQSEAVTFSNGRTFTFTTASSDDTTFGKAIYRGSDTTATLKRAVANEDQTQYTGSMFTINTDTITVTNLEFDGSYTESNKITANSTGGIFYLAGPKKLTLGDGATLQNSKSSINGGAVSVGASAGLQMDSGSLITGCTGANGGGVYSAGGTVTINTGASLTNNTAAAFGGALFIDKNAAHTINGTVTFSGNTAPQGGAIGSNLATITFVGPTSGNDVLSITGNKTSGVSGVDSGAVAALGSTSKFVFTGNVSVTGNTKGGDGTDANTAKNVYERTGGSTIEVGTAGLGEKANIGVYDQTNYNAGDQFGHTADALAKATSYAQYYKLFKNDRDSTLTGMPASSGNALVWGNPVCKVTNKEVVGTATKVVTTPFNSISEAITYINGLEASTIPYASTDTDFGATFPLEMIVDGYEVPSSVAVNVGSTKPITFTTATTSKKSGCDIDAYPYRDTNTPATVKRNFAGDNSLFALTNSSAVTLKNITLDGQSKVGTTAGGAFNVDSGSTLTIADNATIQKFTTTMQGGAIFTSGTVEMTADTSTITEGNSTTKNGGGVHVTTNGTFNMRAGSITKSYAKWSGGGVYVGTDGTFNMYGGTIGGKDMANTTADCGAGVCSYLGGNINIYGGTISYNVASNAGGGIGSWGPTTIQSGKDSDNKTTTPDINNNTATNNGGAVYVANGTFSMSAGTLSNNSATTGGGSAIYYSQPITISGGSITGNTVSADTNCAVQASAATATVTLSGSPTIYDNKYNSSVQRNLGEMANNNAASQIKVDSVGLGSDAKVGVYSINSYNAGDAFAKTYSDAAKGTTTNAQNSTNAGNLSKLKNDKNTKLTGTYGKDANVIWSSEEWLDLTTILPSTGSIYDETWFVVELKDTTNGEIYRQAIKVGKNTANASATKGVLVRSGVPYEVKLKTNNGTWRYIYGSAALDGSMKSNDTWSEDVSMGSSANGTLTLQPTTADTLASGQHELEITTSEKTDTWMDDHVGVANSTAA